MEFGTFWQYQELTDILFLLMAFILLLLVPLLGLFSTFKNFLFTEKSSSHRAEDFALLLGRFMAPRVFSLFVFLFNALLGASLIFILLFKYHHLSRTITSIEIGASIGVITLGISFLILWRKLGFLVWSALFMSSKQKLLLRRNYGLIDYVRALYLLILFFISFLPIEKEIVLWGLIFGFASYTLLRLLSSLRILLLDIRNLFFVFLYLCTCEFLPWVYLLLAVEHIYKHNYFVLLFEYL